MFQLGAIWSVNISIVNKIPSQSYNDDDNDREHILFTSL